MIRYFFIIFFIIFSASAEVVVTEGTYTYTGKISEDEGHHPDILFGWGYAKINITTHAIEGLSENDFILAAKIDQINV